MANSRLHVNDVENYADLARFLNDSGFERDVSDSFVRFLKDSRYNLQEGVFCFYSCHPHYTEPRLEKFHDIGVIWRKNECIYQTVYDWTITEKLGEGILSRLLGLKSVQDRHREARRKSINLRYGNIIYRFR